MIEKPAPNKLSLHWLLNPDVVFLNHGSFGACPIEVLDFQYALRRQLETEPVLFMDRQYYEKMDESRQALASFLGGQPENMVFVPNATSGVNAVLRSSDFEPGERILTTNQSYNACKNAALFVGESRQVPVDIVPLPFPFKSEAEIIEAIENSLKPGTKIALIDHITSATGMVLPLRKIVALLQTNGVEVLVDGAHAPGMVELNLDEIGAEYYTGNCHKWLCAPKGAGFLYVKKEYQEGLHPLSISHGYCGGDKGRGRFFAEFDWTGTDDPTAFFSIPRAIEVVGNFIEGGWDEIRRKNRALALSARPLICEALGVDLPCPDEMIGTLAAFPLPDGDAEDREGLFADDPIQTSLFDDFGIEIPVFHWPAPPKRLIRYSAQLYNHIDQYRYLADALRVALKNN